MYNILNEEHYRQDHFDRYVRHVMNDLDHQRINAPQDAELKSYRTDLFEYIKNLEFLIHSMESPGGRDRVRLMKKQICHEMTLWNNRAAHVHAIIRMDRLDLTRHYPCQ